MNQELLANTEDKMKNMYNFNEEVLIPSRESSFIDNEPQISHRSEEKEKQFLKNIQDTTQKLVKENRIDDIGYEDDSGAVLDVWL